MPVLLSGIRRLAISQRQVHGDLEALRSPSARLHKCSSLYLEHQPDLCLRAKIKDLQVDRLKSSRSPVKRCSLNGFELSLAEQFLIEMRWIHVAVTLSWKDERLPMMPVGPLLSHPQTYKLGSTS